MSGSEEQPEARDAPPPADDRAARVGEAEVDAVTEIHPPYPVRVDASLDAPLSRWLWLVKSILLIPHVVVLAFLWIAFIVLTVVAWFASLLTGRYPRALFDFDVGVLRWSWRVHYYGYAALGTDRYPPFTLADVPDYPARLDVPYPERLSRGLVLVKSWLLALPHWLVVALFAGGSLWISTSPAADVRWDDSWGAGAAQVQGAGTRTLQWTPPAGDWTFVVMRADGSAGVDVDARAGVTVPALPWLWGGLLVLGGVLAVVGALLVALGVHRVRSGPAGPVYPQYAPPPGPSAPPLSPRPAPSDAPRIGTTPGPER